VVERDALHLLGIRGWRRRAVTRDEWRHLMREAKARKGLQRHRWMEGTELQYQLFWEETVHADGTLVKSQYTIKTTLSWTSADNPTNCIA
jgi:hypothetical protein